MKVKNQRRKNSVVETMRSWTKRVKNRERDRKEEMRRLGLCETKRG